MTLSNQQLAWVLEHSAAALRSALSRRSPDQGRRRYIIMLEELEADLLEELRGRLTPPAAVIHLNITAGPESRIPT